MNSKQKIALFIIVYAAISAICLIFLSQLEAFDAYAFTALRNASTPFLDNLFATITFMGSILFWGLMVFMLWLHKNKKMATFLVIGLAIETIVDAILKYSVARPRPTVSEFTPSFPSSHTARAFLGFMIIKYYKPLLLTVAILVAFSRMYLGVHYFSDVLFGAMNGIMIGLIVSFIPEKKIERFLEKVSKRFQV